MNKLLTVGVAVGVLLLFGCRDREAEARKAKEDAEAKARTAAAQKEMEALPKAFQTPDYFKKNQPDKKATPAPETKKTNP